MLSHQRCMCVRVAPFQNVFFDGNSVFFFSFTHPTTRLFLAIQLFFFMNIVIHFETNTGRKPTGNEEEKRISQSIQLQNIVAALMLKQNNVFNLFFLSVSPLSLFLFYSKQITVLLYSLLLATRMTTIDHKNRKEGAKQWFIPLVDELSLTLSTSFKYQQQKNQLIF